MQVFIQFPRITLLISVSLIFEVFYDDLMESGLSIGLFGFLLSLHISGLPYPCNVTHFDLSLFLLL